MPSGSWKMRPEGYERSSATVVAKGAVKESWPMWSLLKRSKPAGQQGSANPDGDLDP